MAWPNTKPYKQGKQLQGRIRNYTRQDIGQCAQIEHIIFHKGNCTLLNYVPKSLTHPLTQVKNGDRQFWK
jgi:hypothetical protein